MFRKRNRRAGIPPHQRTPELYREKVLVYYPIEFEMMLKGAVVQRGKHPVRQFAVMVGSEMRLVTSGDTVDRDTYEALLAAGAIAPMPTGKGDSATETAPESADD